MKKHTRKAIIQTLIYADIFNYPLTDQEIWQYLISEKKISKKDIQEELSTKNGIIKHSGYFCLPNRAHIIYKRIKNEDVNDKKTIFAQRISSFLARIPFILLIGLSGSVAMHNAGKGDDIDLFIITKKQRLWITRLLVFTLLEFLGVRRRRGEKYLKDKICINFLIDETMLSYPKEKQNIYIAHEIAQMKLLFDRYNTYKRFLNKNKWVSKYLPNALIGIKNQDISVKKNKKQSLFIFHYVLLVLEYFAKHIQLWYMKKHGIQNVSDHMLAFYPFSYGNNVLRTYNKKVKQYE